MSNNLDNPNKEWILLGKKEEKFCKSCQHIKSKFMCSNCFSHQCIDKIQQIKEFEYQTQEKRTEVEEKLQYNVEFQKKQKRIIVKKLRIKNLKQQIDTVQQKLEKDQEEIKLIRSKNEEKRKQIEESYQKLNEIQQYLDTKYKDDVQKTIYDLNFINNEIQNHIKNRIKDIFTTIYRVKLKGAYVVFNEVFMPTDGIYKYMHDRHILQGYELMIGAIEAINGQMRWIYPYALRYPCLRILEKHEKNDIKSNVNNNKDKDDVDLDLFGSFELIDKVTNLKNNVNFGEMRSVSTNLNFDQDWKKDLGINHQSIVSINQIIYDMAVYKLGLNNIIPKEAPLNLFKIITYIISSSTILPLESTRFVPQNYN